MTGDGTQPAGLGEPFACVERTAVATLRDLGPYLIAVNDPPWSTVAPDVPVPTTVVVTRNMELAKLERDVETTADDGASVVVGPGGGTALGTSLLRELELQLDEIRDVTEDGIRFLADSYRRVGAACSALGNSRFEEGSEHFWAYAYEHATGERHVHGELISFAVVALSHAQGNDPEFAHRVVDAAGVRAHPEDLGITREQFADSLVGLRAYSHAERLDVGVADLRDLTADHANAAFDFAATLPRR